jgi:hypothetical protein
MPTVINFDKHYCELEVQLREAIRAMSFVLEELDFLESAHESESLQAKALYTDLCKLLGVVEGWIILYGIVCDDTKQEKT